MKELIGRNPESESQISEYTRSENEKWKSVEEASKDVWLKFGSKNIHSFEEYLESKKAFSSSPQIEVVVRGGGPSALLMARQLLNLDPRIHITIFEKNHRLGGMGVDAISPFVDNHINTILSQERLVFQTVMEPRVDVVTNHPVMDKDLPLIANALKATIVVDAAGAEPNKLKGINYGKYIMTSNDYLWFVNGKYNEDGHFGRVDVPVLRDKDGKPYPTLIAAGGNQSRDLQKANELVLLADRWNRELGIPKEKLDVKKAAVDGVRVARLKLGLTDDPQQETQILYRGLDWKMKKLLKIVGNLEYGDPKLREAMGKEISRWEEEDGGRYVTQCEILDIKENPDGPLEVTLKNNANGEARKVLAGNIITAIRFEERAMLGNTVLIGIAVKGAADLSSTGIHIVKEAIPQVKSQIAGISPLPSIESELNAALRRNFKWDLGDEDPVLWAMREGPQYIMKIGFRSIN